jgi:DNA-directed RNA polymerase specialized sigma subunit
MRKIVQRHLEPEIVRIWKSREVEPDECLIPLIDLEIDPEQEITKNWMWASVDAANLGWKKLFILRMYLFHGWTLDQIADPLDITKERVRQIYLQALRAIREKAIELSDYKPTKH